LKEKLPVVLDFLEETLADNRTWIADTKNFSLADITIASHLITLSNAGLNLDETIGEKRPNLLKYMSKILNRPSVKKVLG
jgi:glutathione S-transferase